jgi:uncharacterized protein
MKTIIYILTCAILATFAGKAQAFTVPQKPDNGWYVVDDANKLTNAQIYSLNQRIETFNKTKRNEIGILITPTTGETSIEDAAYEVFNTWGIGKTGLDNGILIMVAANDHKMRIETGKGAEGDITDINANRIISNMKPYLRKNDYAGALGGAIDTITTLMEDRAGQKPIVDSTSIGGHQDHENFPMSIIIILAMLIFMFIGFAVIAWWDKRNQRKAQEKYERVEMAHKALSDRDTATYKRPPPPPAIVATPIPTKMPTSKYHVKKTTNKRHDDSGSSSSSYDSGSSSSSYDSGSSSSYDSSSSSFDSGSGFGGGDSGGGGSSGSW